jgi:hypothetical protein
MKPAYFLLIALFVTFATCKKKDDPAPIPPAPIALDSSKMITVELWESYPDKKLVGVNVVLTRENTDTLNCAIHSLSGDTIFSGVSNAEGRVAFTNVPQLTDTSMHYYVSYGTPGTQYWSYCRAPEGGGCGGGCASGACEIRYGIGWGR